MTDTGKDTRLNDNECQEPIAAGACGHLAAMILELQQMALRLGAANVSSHLQQAYLETQHLKRMQEGSPKCGVSP